MQDSKYSKILTIVLIIIVILILGLLIFWGVSVLTKKNDKQEAEDAITAVDREISKRTNTTVVNPTDQSVELINPYGNLVVDDVDDLNQTTNVPLEYKGFSMIGYIKIPKINVAYPILKETTKKALETSICRLYGPDLNQPGNVVLVGHNYRNGTFFSDNAKLSLGDSIYITDATGQTLNYVIYNKYQTTPEDAEYATRELQAEREITLSTCSDDSSARTIIWAKAE